MIKPSLWLDPSVAECPLNAVSSECFVCDVLFSHCNMGCENCPVLPGTRSMQAETAIASIRQAVIFAEEHEFNRVLIRLIGGDAIRNWEEFQKLCEWLDRERRKFKIPVIVNAVTCGLTIDDSMQSWLCRHIDYLRLTYRWNGSQGLDAWKKKYIFQHAICSRIDWCVTIQTIPVLCDEVNALLKCGKTVCLEYTDLADWDISNFKEFKRQIVKLLGQIQSENTANVRYGLVRSCRDRKSVLNFVNMGKNNIPCRYFSSERLLFSTAKNVLQQAEDMHTADCPVREIYGELRPMRCYISDFLQEMSKKEQNEIL